MSESLAIVRFASAFSRVVLTAASWTVFELRNCASKSSFLAIASISLFKARSPSPPSRILATFAFSASTLLNSAFSPALEAFVSEREASCLYPPIVIRVPPNVSIFPGRLSSKDLSLEPAGFIES